MRKVTKSFIVIILALCLIFTMAAGVSAAVGVSAEDWILYSDMPDGAQIVAEKWTYDQKTYQESQNSSLSGWTLESSDWQKSGGATFNYTTFPAAKYYSTSDQYYKAYKKVAYSSYENATSKRVASNKANGYIFYHYAFPDSYSDGDNLIGDYNGEWGPAHTTQATIWESFYSTSPGTSSSYRDSAGTRIVYKFPGHSNNHSYWWFRLDVRQCTYTDYVKVFKYYKVENKESSTEVTESDTISNVKHWVQINIIPSAVTLNKATTSITVGSSEILTATVTPNNATNKNVTWKSSDTSIATVSNGKVTAIKAGTANITVATADGNKTATCKVTAVPQTIAVTGVTLNKTALTLNKGATSTLTATVSPSNATNKTVTWSSSDTRVATVSNGKITAVGAGTTNITVTTADGKKTAVCKVTVVIPVTGVTLNKTATTLTIEESETLTATVAPSNATNKNVTWKSSNTGVATVSNGKVTAIKAGTANITATSADGNKTAVCKVTVVTKTKIPDIEGLTYNFSNSFNGFGYSKGYHTPLERYELIYTEALANVCYKLDNEGLWGGSCYGMAATSGMFYQEGNGIIPSDFKQGLSLVSQLGVNDRNNKWGLSLKEFIEAVQISQRAKIINVQKTNNENNLNALCRTVEDFQKTGNNPVVISIRGKWKGKEAGHALIGYKLEEISTSKSRLYVYDPNYPNEELFITLTKNNGKYIAWSYTFNEMALWGTGRENSYISFLRYEDYFSVWNDRLKDNNTQMNLVTVNSDHAVITDYQNEVVAVVQNGKVVTDRSDVYPVYIDAVPVDGEVDGDKQTSVWVPIDLYSVENKDEKISDFCVSVVDQDQATSVTTSGDSVAFAVDDSSELNFVQISGENENYEITMNSFLNDDAQTVELSGVSSQGSVALAHFLGMLFGDGINLDSSDQMFINGDKATADDFYDDLPMNIPVEAVVKIGFDEKSVAMTLGEKKMLATNLYTENAEEKKIIWASDDEDIAIVDDSGLVTAVGEGTANIIATCEKAIAVCQVIVSDSFRFIDVIDENAYYFTPVYWAVDNGITKGTSDTTFSPTDTCTRAQVVTFLWRAKGCPEPASSQNPFIDVKNDDYYYKAVLWAVENGITKGTSATTFGPKDGCTRGQVVTFLHRTEGTPTVSGKNPFTDVKSDDYYYNAVLWASSNGVTSGTSATAFSPKGVCTRAQIVTFLYRDLAKE